VHNDTYDNSFTINICSYQFTASTLTHHYPHQHSMSNSNGRNGGGESSRRQTSQERQDKAFKDDAENNYDVVPGTGKPAMMIASAVMNDDKRPPSKELLKWLDPSAEDLRETIQELGTHSTGRAKKFQDRLQQLRSRNTLPQWIITTWSVGLADNMTRGELRERFLEACEDADKVFNRWGDPEDAHVEHNVR
jgi:hypothetical protein